MPHELGNTAMADGTVDVMEKEVPALPSAAKTGKAQDMQRKPRMKPAEQMAKMWAEGDIQGLGDLCKNLGQKRQIETVTADAMELLTEEEGDKLIVWLRWRTTWEDVSQDDGTKLCCDIFALPLRGPASQIEKFILSGRLCEELVAVMRESSLASALPDFVFLPMALPLSTAASLTLDGISALRSAMMAASAGEKGLAAIGRKLRLSLPETEPEEEAVLLGMRLVRVLEENEPEDIFRVGVTEAVGVRAIHSWGQVSNQLSARIGFFVGLPQDVVDAVAFLSAVKANAMLDMFPEGPKEEYLIHACYVENGLLLSRCDGINTAGPVMVPLELSSCCEEVFMDGVSKNALDVNWHSRPNQMPGMPKAKTSMN